MADGEFAFAEELADKRQQLQEVERALPKSALEDAEVEKVAA